MATSTRRISALILASLMAPAFAVFAGNVTFVDRFDRDGAVHGRKASDGKYTWSVYPEEAREKVLVVGGRLVFNASNGVMCIADCGPQRDFELAFDFTYLSTHFARALEVNYRVRGGVARCRLSDGGHAGGYVLRVQKRARACLGLDLLKEGAGQASASTELASVDVTTGNRWAATTRIRLRVEGKHHRVFVDDAAEPALDIDDVEYMEAGWWNIADGGLTGRAIDNLSFTTDLTAAPPAEPSRKSPAPVVSELVKPLWPVRYTGRVTPTPRTVHGMWEVLELAPGGLEVEIESDAHNAVRLAKGLLLDRVEELSQTAEDTPGSHRLVVHLGQLESDYVKGVATRLGVDLSDTVLKPGGYVIRRRDDTILAAGTDHRGAFYAAMTLYQSLGAPKRKLILRCANLDDWPVWPRWYMSSHVYPDEQALVWLAVYKIPGVALQHRDEWRRIRPDGTPAYPGRWQNWAHVLKTYKAFQDRYDLLDYQLAVNVYATKKRKLPMLDITDEKHLAQMVDSFAYVADHGIDHILVGVDDWTPEAKGRYVCPYPAEKVRFNDSVGRAHGYLMKRLHQALHPRYPNLELAFVPAPYSIYRHGVPDKPSRQRYLRDLAEEMPDDIYAVWTGPQIRTHEVKREDFVRWEGYVNNQRSYLWDNTIGSLPPRGWGTRFCDGFEADSQGVMFVNGDFFSKRHQLPTTITAADYLWNPRAYRKGASFRDAVEKMYGSGTAETVEALNREFTALTTTRLERNRALTLLDELDELAARMKNQGWQTRYLTTRLRAERGRVETVTPCLRIRRFRETPELDGKLDEEAWQRAASFEFVPASGGNEAMDFAQCRIGYDDKSLYLGFRAQRSTPFAPSVPLERDGDIWRNSDDLFEVFLQGEKHYSYGQLVFDHAANQWDAEFGLGLHRSWDPEWHVVVQRGETEWTAEVMIPFSSMVPAIEKPVEPGTSWRANVIRQYRAVDRLSAWSPTKGNSNHTKSLFGSLIFE